MEGEEEGWDRGRGEEEDEEEGGREGEDERESSASWRMWRMEEATS